MAHNVQIVNIMTRGALPIGCGFGASLGSTESCQVYEMIHEYNYEPPGRTEGGIMSETSKAVGR